MAFYENFVDLCNSIRKSPTATVEAMGFNPSAPTKCKSLENAEFFSVFKAFLLFFTCQLLSIKNSYNRLYEHRRKHSSEKAKTHRWKRKPGGAGAPRGWEIMYFPSF